MTPYSLLAWAVCGILVCLSTRGESATTPSTPPASSQIVKQINRVNDDGSYTIGYEAADGTFKIETRDANGNVKGMFGFLDATGHIKKVAYSTSNSTESPQNVEDINTVTEFNHPSAKRFIRQRQRSAAGSSLLKYRRPIADSENPDDDTPVLAMLLRRSRQGIPSRSDADELLRLQQTDNADVYGNPGGSSYQVPDIPFRQHFLQGGRNRINNAVLQHHLRQLTPDQLYELQQYTASAGAQVAPEPTYVPRTPVRTTMHPLLQYLSSGGNAARDYDTTYPTRYPYTQPQPQQYAQQYYYQPTTAPYYPSPTYAPGYSGVTSARSYPYQNPNLPEDLRQALVYRMLVAARLLGLESIIQRYASPSMAAAVAEDARAFEYGMQDPRNSYYPRTTPASYISDPRYYPRDVSYPPTQAYPTQAYPTPAGYYNTLAVARANHARQLAAYQQAIVAQDQQRQYRGGQYNNVQDLADDPAILELRRQFENPAIANGRYNPNPVIYRVGVQQPEQSTSDDEYATVTPSSSPSVSSTTAGSATSQRTPTERPTPSYIQRVRSVQVLNPALASPRGSSTTASPTTRRSLQAP